VRLFFAVVPDDVVRSGMFTVAALLRRDPQLCHAPIAWVSEDRLHVTLAFLGEVKAAGVSDVIEVASRPLQHGPAHVELVSAGVFPPRGNARVVWLGPSRTSSLTLIRLHHALWARLHVHGWRSQPKRYSPHVTIGRVRRGEHVVGLRKVVATVPLSSVAWTARRVTLFESRLSGTGVSYRVLAQVPLTTGVR